MDSMILEFWTGDRKEAELPISALDGMTEAQVVSFERIQELLGRTVLLRMVEDLD